MELRGPSRLGLALGRPLWLAARRLQPAGTAPALFAVSPPDEIDHRQAAKAILLMLPVVGRRPATGYSLAFAVAAMALW